MFRGVGLFQITERRASSAAKGPLAYFIQLGPRSRPCRGLPIPLLLGLAAEARRSERAGRTPVATSLIWARRGRPSSCGGRCCLGVAERESPVGSCPQAPTPCEIPPKGSCLCNRQERRAKKPTHQERSAMSLRPSTLRYFRPKQNSPYRVLFGAAAAVRFVILGCGSQLDARSCCLLIR
jgi:hypothetical protein